MILYLNVEFKDWSIATKIFNKIDSKENLSWSLNPKFLYLRFRQMME